MTDEPDADEVVPNPMPGSIPEEIITDDLESPDEIEVDAGLQPSLKEDWDCPPAEQEYMPNNMPDAPLVVQTRKKRKSYHDLSSDEDSTDETLTIDSESDFDSVLRDAETRK